LSDGVGGEGAAAYRQRATVVDGTAIGGLAVAEDQASDGGLHAGVHHE
jgi:hypothetical protein